jgi:hypothetical protein
MRELTLSEINGRFQILERPMALPGNCAVCGAVNKPVVDFGLSLDWYGAVYICVEDLQAAARIVGMVEKPVQTELVQAPVPEKEITDGFLTDLTDLFNAYISGLSSIRNLPASSNPTVPDGNSVGTHEDSGSDIKASDSTLRDERPSGLPSSNGDEFRLFDV